eukprot:gene9966-11016_t
MSLAANWSRQFVYLISSVLICLGLIIWNYQTHNDYGICKESEYASWTKYYIHYIVGGGMGLNLSQFFRVFVTFSGFSDGKLRHPNAIAMLMMISTTQFLSISAFYFDILSSTCIDFIGIKTSPLMWFEWICTVPYMFFLTSMMDVKRTEMKPSDHYIQINGGWSIVLLALGNLPLPRWLLWLQFLLANIMMTLALAWQQLDSYEEYFAAVEEFNGAVKRETLEFVSKEVHDRLRVSQCKMNCAMFMSVMFTVFPLIYYMRWFEFFDDNVFLVLIYTCSFFAKTLFVQIVSDSHVEILDPNKFLLVEEKKKAEESRLMFLRYVFHEVRVPLNSVALGLQLLQDSDHLNEQDRETISLMREATGFMAETLNDVLSLQKIEEGMLELEYKAFQPNNLVKSVLSNFRTQYESKKIEVLYHLDPNVPKEVLGDQFRLEHVLGNLLSNAIKFSDRESTIEVSVTYETKLKGHITFTVKDQGPGMSSDEQKMLFQPFMQIRPGELQKGRGSGLGLSICKTIVSLHNGTIGCTSKQRVGSDRLSGGSEFYFSIDFKEPDRPSTISPSGHESGNVEDREEEPAAGGGDDADHHDDVLPSTSKGNEEGSTDDTTLLRTTHQQQQQSQSKTNEVSHENVGLLSTFSRESSGSCTVTPRSSIDMLDIPSARAIKSMRQHHSTPMNVNTNTNSPAEMNSIQRPTSITSPSGSSRGGEGNVFEDASSSSSSSNSGRIPQEVGEKLSSSLPTIMESSGNSTPLIEAGSSLTATPNPASTPLARGSGSMSGNSLLTPEKTAGKCIQRILVCDDVLSNRKMLEMILRKRGFKCDQCADGIEAVQLFQEKGCDYYDLVFMDSVMPIMCGPEAAQKIRALGYSKLLIGVTGNAMDVDVIDYETSGADLILTKPMRMEALQKLLDYCDRFGCQSHHKRDIPMEQRAKTWVFSC